MNSTLFNFCSPFCQFVKLSFPFLFFFLFFYYMTIYISNLPQVAIELLRILLHLENEYNMVDFYKHRNGSILAITCKCPPEVRALHCFVF